MATTDARTGFRLPWSTDQRSQPDDTHDGESGQATATEPLDAPVEAAVEPQAGDTPEGTDSMAEMTQTAPDVEVADAPVEPTVEPPVAAPAPAAAAAAAKRPNKFLADLTKAMQAAAESAREEAVTRLQADAKTHVEAIHERSASEAADLRRKADDDVAAVREWSKAEIARIREETDQRISARKGNLEFEIEEHAARIERQIEHVQGRVAAFEQEMAEFFERLLGEDDPTRFAALAENLPEPPPFDLDELAATAWLDSASPSTPEATAEATDTGSGEPAAELAPADAEAAMAAIEASAEAAGWDDLVAAEAAAVAEPVEQAEATATVVESDPRLEALGIAPDFAAAEAAAYEAADATDAAEEIPTIADEALAARLAGLVGAEDGTPAIPTGTTQVVVTGLVSVASIASFKRHLGRLAGVQSVGVSSGPEGEFVFAVTHAPDVVLRDSIATLPGFGARVTGGTETTVEVTAHDADAES